MTSPESTEDGSARQQIWMSGEEEVLLIHELLDPAYIKEERGTGRTTRLALKYAELAMKVAPTRVRVDDHHPSMDADKNLLYQVTRILDLFGIGYQLQEVPYAERDPNSLTGVSKTGKKAFYVRAYPKGLPGEG